MDDLREQNEVYIRVRNPDYYEVRIFYMNCIIKIALLKLHNENSYVILKTIKIHKN